MIHFDLDNRYLDDNVVGSAISRRESVVFAVVGHVALALALIYAPNLAWFQPSAEELARREELAQQQREQQRTMVFVQPQMDARTLKALEQAPPSDADRRAQSPQPPREAANAAPRMDGNSQEMNEAAPTETVRGPEAPTPPAQPVPEATEARLLPPADSGFPRQPVERERTRPSGQLGDALRNLQRYVQNQTFDNPQGGKNDPGSTIQFDTKGVEFGPWLRRFVTQVKRNWFVPQAAASFRGHVVLQFNIWKDGHITDITIAQPSSIDSFNNAAYNAIVSSNPVPPLPPEYPSEKAFFTVTFYYNEQPPS